MSQNDFITPFGNSGEQLLFGEASHGHCHALYTRKQHGSAIIETLKLTEGGKNNDSPQSNLIPGIARTDKIYLYHAMALHKAITNPSDTMLLEQLRGVTRTKNNPGATTIVHLCGHKWYLKGA